MFDQGWELGLTKALTKACGLPIYMTNEEE